MPTLPSRRARGLTLIELVVVMAILVILAGLALPKLDVFKLKANKAQAAANMESITNLVTAYKVQHDVFPDRWDSLIGAGGTALFTELHPSLTGGPGGTATKLATLQLSAGQLQSLQRVGIFNVVDHVTGEDVPGNSAKIANLRALTTGDTIATLNLADTTGKVKKILDDYYPDGLGLPAEKSVAVFGLGPANQIIGDLLHEAPFYANANQLTQYNRMLVLFEMDEGGDRARLLGCLAADGDRFEGEIQDYYTN